MDKSKAQDLIAQLERHQQGQLQCMQALLDLVSENETSGEPGRRRRLSVSMNKSLLFGVAGR